MLLCRGVTVTQLHYNAVVQRCDSHNHIIKLLCRVWRSAHMERVTLAKIVSTTNYKTASVLLLKIHDIECFQMSCVVNERFFAAVLIWKSGDTTDRYGRGYMRKHRHRHRHRHKHRDKDRHRHRHKHKHRDKDRHRHRDKDKDRDGHTDTDTDINTGTGTSTDRHRQGRRHKHRYRHRQGHRQGRRRRHRYRYGHGPKKNAPLHTDPFVI